jgi:DsbC/DsbD-like thiol-disulfide interchange protein
MTLPTWRTLRPLALALAGTALAASAPAQVPDVPLTAIPEYASVAPGGTVRVAVRLEVPEGWHIDWVNPGETGLPTTVAWHAPTGFAAGPTAWPFPELLEDLSGVSHVLAGTVFVVTPFTIGPTARTGRVELTADLSWLLCAGSCNRQSGSVRVGVRVDRSARNAAARGPDPAWAPVAAAASSFPAAGEGLTLRASASGDSVRLEILGLQGAPRAGFPVTWFPAAGGRAGLVLPLHAARGAAWIRVPRRHVIGQPPGRLTGVLVGLLVRSGTVSSRGLSVDVPVAEGQP